MILGLAALTSGAHLLVILAHALLHAGLAVALTFADAALLLLGGLGPLAGLALILRGRPRHGAAVLTLLMLTSLAGALLLHYALDGPGHVARRQDDAWGELYAASAFMQVAFALQGATLGALLVAKPQAPRPRNAEVQAP